MINNNNKLIKCHKDKLKRVEIKIAIFYVEYFLHRRSLNSTEGYLYRS